MGSLVPVGRLGERASGAKRRDFLRIELLHQGEAPELTLDAVKVAVMVGIAGDEAVTADVVVGLNARSTTCTGKGSRVIHGFPSCLSCR
jgi:hypothetical protein